MNSLVNETENGVKAGRLFRTLQVPMLDNFMEGTVLSTDAMEAIQSFRNGRERDWEERHREGRRGAS